jgi:hypothetical protein
MALNFSDGQDNEFFAILDLFKTDESDTERIANLLLCKRLTEMKKEVHNLKYFQQFTRELINYSEKSDGIPGKVDSLIYDLFLSVLAENKRSIDQFKRGKIGMEGQIQSLQTICKRLESDKKKLEAELELLQ